MLVVVLLALVFHLYERPRRPTRPGLGWEARWGCDPVQTGLGFHRKTAHIVQQNPADQ